MQSLISFSQFFPAEELLLLHDGKIMYQTLELTEDENGNLRAVPAGKAPIWDSHHAEYVPRTYGWAMWEVLGADGFLFLAPRGYIDPDDPEDNEEEIGHTASGLAPEDAWSYAEGWILFGPNADQYD
jgi:hypothetical protein